MSALIGPEGDPAGKKPKTPDAAIYMDASGEKLERICGALAARLVDYEGVELFTPNSDTSKSRVELVKSKEARKNKGSFPFERLTEQRTQGTILRRIPLLGGAQNLAATSVCIDENCGEYFVNLKFRKVDAGKLRGQRAGVWGSLGEFTNPGAPDLEWNPYAPDLKLVYIPHWADIPEETILGLEDLVTPLPVPVTLSRVAFPEAPETRSGSIG